MTGFHKVAAAAIAPKYVPHEVRDAARFVVLPAASPSIRTRLLVAASPLAFRA